MRLFRTLTLSLIASLLLHLLLGWGLALLPDSPLESSSGDKALSIVELVETPEEAPPIETEKADEKQFVRSAPAPEELLTKEKREKRFASEEEQNVLEEQRAQASGLTANRSQNANTETPPAPPAPPAQQERRKNARRDKLDLRPESALERAQQDQLGDMRVGGLEKRPTEPPEEEDSDGSRPLVLPGFGGLQAGTSTVGEALPDDIKFGDFTALSTDRHLFYTFYARMEEKIRHRWVAYARAAILTYQNSNRRVSGNGTWTTRLEIILDKDGRFLKALLHQGSGIQALDVAPVQAFRDAKQFPNPPREMIKADGKIHLEYAFTVNVAPNVANSED